MTTRTERRTQAPPRVGVVYALAVYLLFLVVLVQFVAFVEGVGLPVGGTDLVPHTVDAGGPGAAAPVALTVDLALLAGFAVQHSLMARVGFKRWWSRWVPTPLERSTYVLASTAALVLLMAAWHPIGGEVWDVQADGIRVLLVAVSLAGWAIALTSTFLIDHWDLVGLRQALAGVRGGSPAPYRFVTPAFYRLVRHPLYVGFLLAFWAAPTMTFSHLVLAAGLTGYILVGLRLEEQDLVRTFGAAYRRYQQRVPALIPRPRRR